MNDGCQDTPKYAVSGEFINRLSLLERGRGWMKAQPSYRQVALALQRQTVLNGTNVSFTNIMCTCSNHNSYLRLKAQSNAGWISKNRHKHKTIICRPSWNFNEFSIISVQNAIIRAIIWNASIRVQHELKTIGPYRLEKFPFMRFWRFISSANRKLCLIYYEHLIYYAEGNSVLKEKSTQIRNR